MRKEQMYRTMTKLMTAFSWLAIVSVIAFAVCVVAVIIADTTAHSFMDDYEGFIKRDEISPPSFVVATSGLFWITAYVVFCGVMRNLSGVAQVFVVFDFVLCGIFIWEIVAANAAINRSYFLKEILEVSMNNSFFYYNTNSSVKRLWDFMQLSLNCCGYYGKVDYLAKGVELPESCCLKNDSKCITEDKNGCFQVLYETLMARISPLLLFSILATSIQFLPLIIGNVLMFSERKTNLMKIEDRKDMEEQRASTDDKLDSSSRQFLKDK